MPEADPRLLKAIRELDNERAEKLRLQKHVRQLTTRLANLKRTAADAKPKPEARPR